MGAHRNQAKRGCPAAFLGLAEMQADAHPSTPGRAMTRR